MSEFNQHIVFINTYFKSNEFIEIKHSRKHIHADQPIQLLDTKHKKKHGNRNKEKLHFVRRQYYWNVCKLNLSIICISMSLVYENQNYSIRMLCTQSFPYFICFQVALCISIGLSFN